MFDKSYSSDMEAAASQYYKERAYWLKNLSGDLVKSTFPFDHRTHDKNRKMNTVPIQFSRDVKTKLLWMSNESDSRLLMILAAGLVALIEKYTNNSDIILGTPISKQPVEGKFLNTILVLRNQVKGNMSFKELLYQVKQTIDQAVENQNYPLKSLLYELNLPYSEEDFPLFDIAVMVENIQNRKYIQHIQTNMMFSFSRVEDSLEGTLEYNRGIFLEETTERISIHFNRLMEQVLFHVNIPLSQVDLLSEEEKKKLVEDFNNTWKDEIGSVYQLNKTLHQLFEEQVERTPDHTAVIFIEQEKEQEASSREGKKALTYQQLNEKANGLARVLRKKGIGPEGIAALLMESSIPMVLAVLAVLKAGGAYLPIDLEVPEERKTYMLKDSRVYLVLTDQPEEAISLYTTVDPGGIEMFDVSDERIYDRNDTPPDSKNKPSDLAYIIYTSGSTGKPKGVMVEHRHAVNTLVYRKEEYRMDSQHTALQLFSYAFDGFITSFFTPIISGARVVLLSKHTIEDITKIVKVIAANQVTHFISIPILYQAILNNITEVEASSLQVVTLAGDQVQPHLLEMTAAKNENIEIVNEYGITEAAVMSTIYRHQEKDPKIKIGHPGRNTWIYITRAVGAGSTGDRQLLPIGVYGEMCIAGAGVARGYLDNPDLTAVKFAEDPFRTDRHGRDIHTRMLKTGDMARWLPDGNIEFSGRMDYQVKIRGFRIELEEIERQLLKQKNIKETVVVAKENNDGDKHLCAYIVSTKELNVSELREYLSGYLPNYMIPSYFVPLDKIPLIPNGKIDRKVLPEPEVKTDEKHVAPRNKMEKKLAEIWSDVLGIEKDKIGIDSNFFEVGGHSLKATVLLSRIHKEFNAKLPVAKIFETPTVRGLAEYIKKAAEDAFTSIQPVEEKNYYALSPPQKRLYILQQMEPESIAYNIYEFVHLEGEVDREKLEETFRQLINWHESLRTSFRTVEGKPMQKVHNKNEVDFRIEYYDEVEHFIRPFDLSREPLLRVGLVKVKETNHILIVDMHHIISDGVSHKIFIENFISLYEGRRLPLLRIQYKDYSEWQQSLEVKEAIKHQEAYWLQEFEGEIPVLNLPTDFPRPAIQSFEGKLFTFEISQEESKALDEIARCQEVTLFMALLAVFKIFLSKLSTQEDIVVGIPIAGRKHANLEQIIGMFVNTLLLRSYPLGEKTFLGFLSEVKEKLLAAFENQNYQFEELVEKVAVERDMSRNPLFDTMFILEDIFEEPDQVLENKLEGLTIKPYKHEHKVAKFDLTLSAINAANKLRFTFEYCTKLFKEAAIERFARYFKEVVSAVSENPGAKISRIEIITGEEKRQILFGFNDTHAEYPGDKTIHELFEEQAARTPDKIALIDLQQQEHRMTYRRLNQGANQLALRLRAKGVAPNGIVGIMADLSTEAVVGMLAVIKAGGAYLPIDVNYPLERMKLMLHDSQTSIILTQKSLFETDNEESLEAPVQEIIFLDEEKSYTGEAGCVENVNKPGDMIYVMYTSGSTGTPKGVIIEHRSVVNLLTWFGKTYHIGKDTRVLQLTDYTFDPSVEDMFGTLLNGGTLFVAGKELMLDRNRFCQLVKENQIHVINFVPHMLKELLVHEQKLESLRVVISGGDVLEEWVKDQILARGYPLYNNYGPTEITVDALSAKCSEGRVTLGHPVSNVKCYIIDNEQHLLPVGVPGELCVSGEGLARGYLNHPELTAETFVPSPFFASESLYKTGDLARWLPDGSIEFRGRVDHQMKIRGFRVEPGEIENRLLNHNDIQEAVVISKKNKRGDRYLCAYIAAGTTCNASQLKEYLSKELPEYMVPLYFKQIEKTPLTPSGKVDRKTLASYDMELDTGVEYAPPKNKVEEIMVSIWKEILTLDKVGIYDNFFDLGGNSLNIIEVNHKLKEVIGKKIPVVNMFRYPTIRSLSRYLSQEETGDPLFDSEIQESVQMLDDTMQMLMGDEDE